MLDAETLKNNLEHFCGSEQLHRNLLGIRYTHGVKYLAQNSKCYWLIDAIASHQPNVRKIQSLREFKLWFLHVGDSHEFIKPKGKNKAVLTCWEDTPTSGTKAAVIQHIKYTAFTF
jgi:hypothetical protein